jgi:hypothetical protein
MDGDIVPFNIKEKDLRDEVNRRSAKAGYTTRLGESPDRTKIQTTVPFGREKLNIWPRDKNGNLIP